MKLLQLLVFLLCMASCGRQERNSTLASTYFKMSYVELLEDGDSQAAYRRSLAHVDRALSYDQKPEYYALKATLLFKLNSFDSSEECFKKALTMTQDQVVRSEVVNNYACLLAEKGFVARAKEMWEGLCRDTSYQTPEVAFVNLGKISVKNKQFEQAKNFFQQAVHISPSFVDAHVYLAHVAKQLGDCTLLEQEKTILHSLESESSHVLESV